MTSKRFFLQFKFNGLIKRLKSSVLVIPAKAGIQLSQNLMDSRFRGSDGNFDRIAPRREELPQAEPRLQGEELHFLRMHQSLY
jgi:hypothetical protein